MHSISFPAWIVKTRYVFMIHMYLFNQNVKPVLFCKGAGGAGAYFVERLMPASVMGRNEKHP
jgi:hypothetical protein